MGLPQSIRFHGLRHFAATLMLAAGVHPKVASERLGHSQIAVTLDLYSHAFSGLDVEAAEQMQQLIRSTPVVPLMVPPTPEGTAAELPGAPTSAMLNSCEELTG